MPSLALPDSLAAELGDRYSIVRALGQGGMATVYLARDRKHDRDVAIKVLRDDVAESLGRERFLREIRLAARLNHPQILPLYDSGEAGSTLFYVMPVMEGETLRTRLAREPRLPVDEAVHIALEVADALDYAHRHDIVHRDIKPENILLHEGHAIVADFGIGKAVVAAAPAAATLVTQVGVTVGTPAYMSPEQAAGDEIDGRSDLFALGCVLYEMLTGELPFTGPTIQAVIAKRFHHVPPAVSETQPSVPVAVSRVVDRLLEKSPEQRFASGAMVVRALQGRPENGQGTPREAPSIAVLPFANMSADADNEFFSDGITDDIIGALTKVPGLKVAARASSFSFRGRDVAVPDVGRRLGVRHVLQGSVRRAGNRVRVTAQLMESRADVQQWSERYDRDLDDIFAIQDDIVRQIVTELEVVLGLRDQATLVVRPTDSLEAYDLFLRGREALRRRTPTSVRHGIEFMTQAIGRDARFARAWLGLVEGNAALGVYGYEPPARCRLRAEEALAEATRIGGSEGELPIHRAFVKLYLRPDWPDAGADLTAALAATPRDMLANTLATLWHGLMGDAAARTAAARRATESDPLSPWMHAMVAFGYGFTGEHDAALASQEAALRLDGNALAALWGSSLSLCHLGRADEALGRMHRAVEIAEQGPTLVAIQAYVLHAAGRHDEARRLADRLWAQHADHAYATLVAEVRQGDDDRIARALENAVAREAGTIALATTIRRELERLLVHPTHGAMVRRLNLYARGPLLAGMRGGA